MLSDVQMLFQNPLFPCWALKVVQKGKFVFCSLAHILMKYELPGFPSQCCQSLHYLLGVSLLSLRKGKAMFSFITLTLLSPQGLPPLSILNTPL